MHRLKTNLITALTVGQDFYDKMVEFLLTEQQLSENGYPRCDPDVPRRAVYKKDSTVKLYVDNEGVNEKNMV